MRPLGATRKALAILIVAFGLAAGTAALPDNEYQRWQLLDGTIHARARWIYERSRFDPTPIDVAFVGPSRTGAAVDAPQLGAELAAKGLPSHVVNFSLPEGGRNIDLPIVQQLLTYKQPKLLVLGITEKPQRTGHSAFKYISPTSLIVDPGYLANIDYLPDLAYLPFRQLHLFAADLFPQAAGLTKTFDARRYDGPSVDTTGSVILPDGRIKEGERPASYQELERGVRKLEAGAHPPFLPRSMADVEFGDERHYLTEIIDLAHAHGVKVAFLFLPYYAGPSTIQEQDFYARFGPVWNEGWLAAHAEFYADYGHLTRGAAQQLTHALVAPVGEMLQSPEATHGHA
jgi:hypothetical protein